MDKDKITKVIVTSASTKVHETENLPLQCQQKTIQRRGREMDKDKVSEVIVASAGTKKRETAKLPLQCRRKTMQRRGIEMNKDKRSTVILASKGTKNYEYDKIPMGTHFLLRCCGGRMNTMMNKWNENKNGKWNTSRMIQAGIDGWWRSFWCVHFERIYKI